MNQKSLDFLKNLLTTPSPTGFERRGQRVWLNYADRFADQTETDAYGSAIAAINPDAETKVMIVGHADEIGLMIRHIDEKGFCYPAMIGGVDAKVAIGKRLNIHTAKGIVRGVTGATAIHLQDRKKESKPPEIHQVFIDIGAKGKGEAEKKVTVGDPITFVDDFEMIDKNIGIARAFDNRIGTWIAAETLRLIRAAKQQCKVGVYAVSAVQEEIGCVGSGMVAHRVQPDIGLITDVGHATDSPEIDHRKHGYFELGGGPILALGAAILPELTQRLEKVAKRKRIKLQKAAAPGRTGTDTDSVYKSMSGIPCALVSLPIRYMHTTVEMTDLRDLEAIARLFAAFCLSLKKGESFKAKI